MSTFNNFNTSILTGTLDFFNKPSIFLSSIFELFDGYLLAAPKKRTTHSKKRKRMAMKWPKPLKNITPCPFCNQPCLENHLCRNCLKDMKVRDSTTK
ncbi:hypothetical protein HDU92_006024 [Lobulomyces angularis]|nr:hypothetical protein HDU92_006024 [Lobulomyces angularis]